MNIKLLRYFDDAKKSGCPSDLVRRLLQYNIVLQPKQLLASAMARSCDPICQHTNSVLCSPDIGCAPAELGYGGARGGGKSHWGMAQLVDDCLRFPGLKCLILRKVGKAGKENFDDLRLRMLMLIPHDYRRQEGVLIFRNGSRIVLGHFQNERDIDNYLGIEYDVILVEEATTLSYEKYRDIKTCCRTSKRGWHPRVYSTTNPGGVGHGWYKELFVDPWKAGVQCLTRFVPATVRDNAMANAGYRTTLETLTGWIRRAWLDGDWDIAIGQFFTTFRPKVHVLAEPIKEVPESWTTWMSLDYGFTHFTTAYLFAQPPGENQPVYCLSEHGQRRWLPKRHSDALLGMLDRFGLERHRLAKVVAGHDCWNKDRDGGAPVLDYREEGWELTRAHIDRVAGAAEVLARLGDVETDIPVQPSLYINPECTNIIKTLPLLEHDPHHPEDVLKVHADEEGRGGDDWYDSFRYGVMFAGSRKPARAFAGPPRAIPTSVPPAMARPGLVVANAPHLMPYLR